MIKNKYHIIYNYNLKKRLSEKSYSCRAICKSPLQQNLKQLISNRIKFENIRFKLGKIMFWTFRTAPYNYIIY